MLADGAGLSDAEVQGVRTAALLHDIGNMAVPEHILAKPVPLTPEEFERIKITRGLAPRSSAACRLARRWPTWCSPITSDGTASGYPSGLRGEEIPIGARILAIADCYSTMQSDRPYRPARSEAAAIAELREEAGTAFDPALVDLLITRLNRSGRRHRRSIR